jgi:hypothetical protein
MLRERFQGNSGGSATAVETLWREGAKWITPSPEEGGVLAQTAQQDLNIYVACAINRKRQKTGAG